MKKLSEYALSKNFVPTNKLSQSNALVEQEGIKPVDVPIIKPSETYGSKQLDTVMTKQQETVISKPAEPLIIKPVEVKMDTFQHNSILSSKPVDKPVDAPLIKEIPSIQPK